VSIFRRGELRGEPFPARRFKIRITTADGRILYWHKRGQLHILEEDVARIFVANFKPALFQVRPDGSFDSPSASETSPVEKVEMEPA
jgi:hypothetical protein